MLSKGSELFMFEGEFFKLKQRYINEVMTEALWHKLMDDCEALMKKYHTNNDLVGSYCFQSLTAYVEFLRYKENNNYEMRPGLLEVRT